MRGIAEIRIFIDIADIKGIETIWPIVQQPVLEPIGGVMQ
jgi:hypothetical protein